MKGRIEKGYILPSGLNMIFSFDDILFESSEFKEVLLSSLIKNIKDFNIMGIYDFLIKSSGTFKNNFEMLIDDLKFMISNDYRIIFMA